MQKTPKNLGSLFLDDFAAVQYEKIYLYKI